MASSTSTLTLPLPSSMIPSSACPSCGNSDTATRRILDLEAQVRALNTKAAAAADKLADYEDEVRYLRTAYSRSSQQSAQRTSSDSVTSTTLPQYSPPLNSQSRLASLSALIPGRRRDINNNTVLPPASNSPSLTTLPNKSTPSLSSVAGGGGGGSNANGLSLQSLQSTLETERTLRLRAESNLNQTQHELEDLTAQLFGQANEMVANERKARARLEERVKVLENRDLEKRRRLERLEGAVERIERVRKMINS